MYRMYVAIKTLNKVHGRKSFDLLRAKYELLEKTKLFVWLDRFHGINESDPLEYRLQRLEELLENAEKIGLIKNVNNGGWKKVFVIDVAGRNFLKPQYFLEYSAREFGYTASIFSAFFVGLVLAYLAHVLGI